MIERQTPNKKEAYIVYVRYAFLDLSSKPKIENEIRRNQTKSYMTKNKIKRIVRINYLSE